MGEYFYGLEVFMSVYNGKITRKFIRKEWQRYMQMQLDKLIGHLYDPHSYRILDSGSVVKLDGKLGKEVIEEVGLDYNTFKMKFDTSDNPLGI